MGTVTTVADMTHDAFDLFCEFAFLQDCTPPSVLISNGNNPLQYSEPCKSLLIVDL